MRITLTIDEDVAEQLEALRRRERRSLKAVVNEALRRGLHDLGTERNPPREPFKTKTFDLGPIKFPVDNVAEALAFAESEDFK
jgi:hypothetical protein